MDSSTIFNDDGSVSVIIKDPVEFILGRENVKISLSALSSRKRVCLLRNHVKRCTSSVFHRSAISFEDISCSFPWKTDDYAITCQKGFSATSRLVQLCHPKSGSPPNYSPPEARDSKWAEYSLYVMETQDILLICKAVKGSRVSQFKLDILDDKAITELFDRYENLCRECLQFLDRIVEFGFQNEPRRYAISGRFV